VLLSITPSKKEYFSIFIADTSALLCILEKSVSHLHSMDFGLSSVRWVRIKVGQIAYFQLMCVRDPVRHLSIHSVRLISWFGVTGQTGSGPAQG